MAGLRKQKKYDWKDSNLALFGSDTEKSIKKESAETEAAWREAGQKLGLQIWRIVKFKVTHWPKEEYGKFYSGDSYIILNTYKEEGFDELLYDVHFWIGKYSTQDEYGTAAYKTVELDTLLDDKPIQHREVQGHESALFRSYFKSITLLEGGADSGFRTVTPEQYRHRLLHFKGDRFGIKIKEVPHCRGCLDSSDVFILDMGLTIYQWNGRTSNGHERIKAMQYLSTLKSERCGRAETETIDEEGTDSAHPFYASLEENSEDMDDSDADEIKDKTKELFRLSDSSGRMKFSLEKKGTVKMSDFDSKDVFILDTKEEVIVWIGRKTSTAEQKNALIFAHNYLKNTDHQLLPVACLREGMRSKQLTSAIAA